MYTHACSHTCTFGKGLKKADRPPNPISGRRKNKMYEKKKKVSMLIYDNNYTYIIMYYNYTCIRTPCVCMLHDLHHIGPELHAPWAISN